jgi:hypothetical protein
MKKTIDELSQDITKELSGQELKKALPPKIAYRIRKWLKQHGGQHSKLSTKMIQQTLTQKMEEALLLKELKKNEGMVSIFDNGEVKMDFGKEVDPKLKKAALEWVKKRGLKPIEASLNKSDSSFDSMSFAANSAINLANSVKRFKIQ